MKTQINNTELKNAEAKRDNIWTEIMEACNRIAKNKNQPLFDMIVALIIAQDISDAILSTFEKNTSRFDKEKIDLEIIETLHHIRDIGQKSIPILGVRYEYMLEKEK